YVMVISVTYLSTPFYFRRASSGSFTSKNHMLPLGIPRNPVLNSPRGQKWWTKLDHDMVGSVSDTPTPPKIHTSVTVNRADGFHLPTGRVTSIVAGLTWSHARGSLAPQTPVA